MLPSWQAGRKMRLQLVGTRKLIAVGALGASRNKHLARVEKSRKEWAERGHQEVETMKESATNEGAEIGGLALHL